MEPCNGMRKRDFEATSQPQYYRVSERRQYIVIHRLIFLYIEISKNPFTWWNKGWLGFFHVRNLGFSGKMIAWRVGQVWTSWKCSFLNTTRPRSWLTAQSCQITSNPCCLSECDCSILWGLCYWLNNTGCHIRPSDHDLNTWNQSSQIGIIHGGTIRPVCLWNLS